MCIRDSPGIGLPILLQGQTGTGKSYIAQLTYEYSCLLYTSSFSAYGSWIVGFLCLAILKMKNDDRLPRCV